jgi:hypothetical protein
MQSRDFMIENLTHFIMGVTAYNMYGDLLFSIDMDMDFMDMSVSFSSFNSSKVKILIWIHNMPFHYQN